MSDPETEAIRALEYLFLQNGVQGGKQFFSHCFSSSYLLSVESVLTQFESRMRSHFPHQAVHLRR